MPYEDIRNRYVHYATLRAPETPSNTALQESEGPPEEHSILIGEELDEAMMTLEGYDTPELQQLITHFKRLQRQQAKNVTYIPEPIRDHADIDKPLGINKIDRPSKLFFRTLQDTRYKQARGNLRAYPRIHIKRPIIIVTAI